MQLDKLMAVRAGDTIVLRVTQELSLAERHRLSDALRQLLPLGTGVIVLPPGVDLSVFSEAKDGLPEQPAV